VKVGGFVWRLYFISGSSVVTEEGEREEMRGRAKEGSGGRPGRRPPPPRFSAGVAFSLDSRSRLLLFQNERPSP
jgi:hypothetical protein